MSHSLRRFVSVIVLLIALVVIFAANVALADPAQAWTAPLDFAPWCDTVFSVFLDCGSAQVV